MTFTVLEQFPGATFHSTVDLESLDELFQLGHDFYGDAPMDIDWATLTITVHLGR